MYTLIRLIPLRHLLLEQMPALGGSLLIAELFYKFHSFTLECIAFLATWYVLDGAITLLSRVWKPLPTNQSG
jgi:hypothetical protein